MSRPAQRVGEGLVDQTLGEDEPVDLVGHGQNLHSVVFAIEKCLFNTQIGEGIARLLQRAETVAVVSTLRISRASTRR